MRTALLILFAVPFVSRADDAKALAPLLDDRAFAVLRLDLEKIDVARLIERLTTGAEPKPTHLSRAAREWKATAEGLVQDGARVVYLVASLADVPDDYPFLVVPLGGGADAGKLTARLAVLKQLDPGFGVSRRGDALVAGSDRVVKRLEGAKPVRRPDLIDGLGKDAPAARLVVAPTIHTGRILGEVLPELPKELGGGSTRPLSQGLRTLRVDVEAAPRLALRLTAECRDAGMAEALDGMVRRVLGALAANKAVLAAAPKLPELAALWNPKRDGSRLTLGFDEKAVVGLLGPYVDRLILSERAARTAVQLRQVAAATHAYLDRHGTFPAAASYGKAGKPLLSWRVHLLPFLGEEKLYKEFKLDEPWDSPHNKALLAKMPKVYQPHDEALATQHRTTFLAPRGEHLMFPEKRGVSVREVLDGTSNTILLVDADDAHAVEWTRPGDLKIDERDPLKGLSRRHAGEVLVAFADAAVRTLPGTMAAHQLWALFTRDQGEVVELP